jgi:hypothetical protein
MRFLAIFAVLFLSSLLVESKSVWGLVGILNYDCLASFDDSTGNVQVLLNLSSVLSGPLTPLIHSLAAIGSYCVALQFRDGSNQENNLGRFCIGNYNVSIFETGYNFGKLFYDDSLVGLVSVYPNYYNNGYQADYINLNSGAVQQGVIQFSSGECSFVAYSYSVNQSEVVGFGSESQYYVAEGYSVLTGVNMMKSNLYAGSSTYQFMDSASYDKNGTFIGVALYSGNTPGIYTIIDDNQNFAMDFIMTTGVPNSKSTFFSGSFMDSTSKYYVVFNNIAGYQLYIYNVDSATLVNKFNLGTANGLHNIVAVTSN